jgi:dGTPase
LEYKTQVFVNHVGDHYRTRLTHSLEVAQLARSISRVLGLDEDVAEALALAHDLGHTPFGHAGEDALEEVMHKYGGFDHNAQALRILTSLEHRYADYDGLNLSWEVLEGITKHNGPLITVNMKKKMPWAIEEYIQKQDLRLDSYPNMEAQVAAIADDIAYNNHDMEDGIRAGLFSLDDLREIALVNTVINLVDEAHPVLEEKRRVHEVIRRIINRLVTDVVATTKQNVAVYNLKNIEDVRSAGKLLVHFSEETEANHKQLKAFLMKHMYRHYTVNRASSKARRVVKELFTFFHSEPECLPYEWGKHMDKMDNDVSRARLISDFIAGMTDRFALTEHQRIFDVWKR